MPRRQTFIQQVRGRNPVLLVDGGDCFFGAATKKAAAKDAEMLALRQARAIVHAYNYMGYQALGLGPADLQLGVDKLKGVLREATFPVLCANLIDKATGKPVFKDSVVVEVAGIRFGVYGVVLSSLNSTYKKRILGERYDLLDAIEVSRRVVAELRKRCDVLVALSHLNKPDNVQVAESAEGIDVIVDPYSMFGNKTIWIVAGDYLDEKGGAFIVRIDGQGSRVGVFEMYFSGNEKRYASYDCFDYPLEPQIFPDPQLSEAVRGLLRGSENAPPIGFDPLQVHLLEDRFLGEEACGGCHERQHEFWKSTGHSSAYENLRAEKNHLKHDCVECHTTAYGVAYADPKKVGRFTDVQCESCHGVKLEHAEDPKRHRLGKVKEDTCWGCHNPEFTRKPFSYDDARDKAACPDMKEG